ncbi:hypothetical protein BDV93DRAFT_542387 [Ceratobasidium sp. AG-I]|nr:hypothetical protein BDV93DRAFT_542387 [Ceratobasidium sp. AG-I]
MLPRTALVVQPNESINAVPKPLHGVWEGECKIVLGVDIGTTQSGVAFTFLQKGSNKVIRRVTDWPGQEYHTQQGKIPTILWYDRNNTAVSFGAEALTPFAQEDAEENMWRLAKYFKLHLHPDDMKVKNSLKLNVLPPGISLQQVYSDFLRYLLQQTKLFFEGCIPDGKKVWKAYAPTMEIIIAHPNGWGIREQTFLRAVAVRAGLSDAQTAHARVRFVTEAEASVHFCIYNTNLGESLQPGTCFAVCDAGGSTVDTTVYRVISAHPTLKIEETHASACVQAGAVFVDTAVEEYLRKLLTEARLGEDTINDYVNHGVKDFERIAKKSFRDAFLDQSVEIAGPRFNNSGMKIRRGRITLSGLVIKSFFDSCVGDITGSVDEQLRDSDVSYILLVGGFGENPFLRQVFKTRYEVRGCEIAATNDSTSKAVADGAVMWSTADSVTSRASRFSYGISARIRYDSRSLEHQGRRTYTCASGHQLVSGRWCRVIDKGTVLNSKDVCKHTFHRTYSMPNPDLESFEVPLLSYSGDRLEHWAKDKQGNMLQGFNKVCTIHTDLTSLSGALVANFGARGVKYWSLTFNVCVRFGGTELLAYLEWQEDGSTNSGPATIVAAGLA